MSQRTGTRAASCNGHSGCLAALSPIPTCHRCIAKFRLVLTSRLIAAALIHHKPRYSLSDITFPSPSRTAPLSIFPRDQAGVPCRRLHSAHPAPVWNPETCLASDFSRLQIYPSRTATRRIMTAAQARETLYGCRVPASRRRDKVHRRLAAFQPWRAVRGRGNKIEIRKDMPARRENPTCRRQVALQPSSKISGLVREFISPVVLWMKPWPPNERTMLATLHGVPRPSWRRDDPFRKMPVLPLGSV